jgi:hypothetical protein
MEFSLVYNSAVNVALQKKNTVLEFRVSSNCKRLASPLVREGAPHEQTLTL